MKRIKLSAEELALGEEMATSLKRRREVEEEGFHRYMGFGEQAANLPGWFVTDERRHMRRPLPVDNARVAEYARRDRAVDVRTIGKVAEARARKKAKAEKRLKKVRRKAEALTGEDAMPEGEKWGKIKELYRKAGFLGQKKRSVRFVVNQRSGARPVRGHKAKKGQPVVTKVVDKRLKADLRGERAAQRGRKGGGRGRGRGRGRGGRR